MSNINLIISGTLTGYAHFYASAGAYDIYNEDKLDLDYRNYVSFLLDGEKAYAISFGKNVIAISLVCRSWDSFHRPGVVVYTALMHKREKIVSKFASQSGTGMYDLLNEVHAMFMQQNCVNGVLNQNLNLLKQDYYSDILSRYEVVPDLNQHSFSTYVDGTSIGKQVGYVVPENGDIASYLDTPCRRNYARYSHVFLAANAPANIDETAKETILYTIFVTNTRQTISGVKLNDKIVKLEPGEFECSINTDYTYQQVLEGQAPRIRMIARGDGYELTYSFPKMTKSITFKCMLDGMEIPFERCSIKFSDGLPITMNPFVFEGEELRGDKLLTIQSTDYAIKSGYDRLPLSRCKESDVFVIQLEKKRKVESYIPPRPVVPSTPRSVSQNIQSPSYTAPKNVVSSTSTTITTTSRGVTVITESNDRDFNYKKLFAIIGLVVVLFGGGTLAYYLCWPKDTEFIFYDNHGKIWSSVDSLRLEDDRGNHLIAYKVNDSKSFSCSVSVSKINKLEVRAYVSYGDTTFSQLCSLSTKNTMISLDDIRKDIEVMEAVQKEIEAAKKKTEPAQKAPNASKIVAEQKKATKSGEKTPEDRSISDEQYKAVLNVIVHKLIECERIVGEDNKDNVIKAEVWNIIANQYCDYYDRSVFLDKDPNKRKPGVWDEDGKIISIYMVELRKRQVDEYHLFDHLGITSPYEGKDGYENPQYPNL